ncbi:BclA C-terminal domain-containing protein [Paenibacillus taihuensis]|uniref:BclA C-terminal domain-containing protein n=1 Tax=Paenibacillus taihuensis TaxID=1156355 RepID=UPI0011C060C4|nr:collagen-like protein [Paenibacillus taihuensis]
MQGPAGATGAQGPTGSAGSTDYGYVYQSTAQEVAIGESVTFDTNGVLFGGIGHTVGDAEVSLNVAGTYYIQFSVTSEQPCQFALFVNGQFYPGTIYGSAESNHQDAGQAIVRVQGVPGTLTLRNYLSLDTVVLETLAGGTEANVTASLTIVKL